MEEYEVEYEIEEFRLGQFQLGITTVAQMPIEVLMMNQSINKEISGQKLWCGSLCLIKLLLSNKQLVIGKNYVSS